MVTTVQRTFRKKVLHALHKAKEVNHAVLISYSRQIESLDPLSFFNYGAKKYTGNRFFWSDPESELTIVGLGKEAVFQTNQKNSERYREVFEQWERFKKTAFHIYEEEKLQWDLCYSEDFLLTLAKKEVHNGTISRKGISLCLRLC
nr:Unknown [Bacillus subtilis]